MARPRPTRPLTTTAEAERPRAARSIAALVAGEGVNKITRFLAAVVLARALPLDDFGIVNVAIAVGGVAVVATTFGLPETGSREVARDPEAPRRVAGEVVAARAIGLTIVVACAALVALAVDPGSTPIVLLAGFAVLGLAVSADWLLRGLERMAALAAATAFGGVCVLAGAFLVGEIEPTAEAALLVFGAGELAAALVTWARSPVRGLELPTIRTLIAAVRRSWHFGLSALVIYAYYANVDTIILSVTRSAEEAGLYSAPYRVFLALNAVGLFAAYACLPMLSRAQGTGGQLVAERQFRAYLGPLCAYGLLLLAAAELVGGDLLRLVFGERFDGLGPAFVVLCASLPWYCVGFPAGYALIARDAGRAFLTGAGIAGTANLLLNLALIPPFGVEGAATATALSMIAGAATWMVLQRPLLGPLLWPMAGLMALGAAAAAVAASAEELAPVMATATLVLALVAVALARRVATAD